MRLHLPHLHHEPRPGELPDGCRDLPRPPATLVALLGEPTGMTAGRWSWTVTGTGVGR